MAAKRIGVKKNRTPRLELIDPAIQRLIDAHREEWLEARVAGMDYEYLLEAAIVDTRPLPRRIQE